MKYKYLEDAWYIWVNWNFMLYILDEKNDLLSNMIFGSVFH